MQVGDHLVHLLRRENISEPLHLVSAQNDDVSDSIVARRHATLTQILLLEHPFETGPLAPARGIRRMATVAILVVNVAAVGLLWIQPKFRITSSALDFTGGKHDQKQTTHNCRHPSNFQLQSTRHRVESYNSRSRRL